MKFKQVDMTPRRAARLLAHNDGNRTISKQRVASYARDMAAGHWVLNPQPIVVNGNQLIDGQHRLSAVVQSGATVPMFICNGAPDSVRTHIDQLRPRTVADALHMQGIAGHAPKVAAIMRVVARLRGDEIGLRHTATEIIELAQPYERALAWAHTVPHKRGISRAAVIGPLVWCYEAAENYVGDFMTGVVSGEGLQRRAPEHTLREHLLTRAAHNSGGAMGQMQVSLRTLSAFRAYCEGEELSAMRLSTVGYDYFCKWLNQPIDRSDYIHRMANADRSKVERTPKRRSEPKKTQTRMVMDYAS